MIVPQEPGRLPPQQVLHASIETELILPIDLAVERVDASIKRRQLINGHDRRKGIGDIGGVLRPVSSIMRTMKVGPPLLTMSLARLVTMISRRKRVLLDFGGEALPHQSAGNRRRAPGRDSGSSGTVELMRLVFEIDFRIGEQHGKLGPRQGLPRGLPLQQRRIGGQGFRRRGRDGLAFRAFASSRCWKPRSESHPFRQG